MATETAPPRKSNETSAAYAARTKEFPRHGLKLGVAPDGETPIFVPDAPDAPKWLVKHQNFGARFVYAASAQEALRKFFGEHAPAEAGDDRWYSEMARLARVSPQNEKARAAAKAEKGGKGGSEPNGPKK